MTAEEVERLLQIAALDKQAENWKAGERALVYQLFLGTGFPCQCVLSALGTTD